MPYRRSFVNHVVVKTTILIVVLTACQTKPIRHKREVFCYPEKYLYYVEQIGKCRECDMCYTGQEPDLQGADLGMGLNGATKCPTCRRCREGTYNPNGDVHWKCLPCTTCSGGLHEVQACSATQDTSCSNSVRHPSKRFVYSTPGPPASVQQEIKGEDSDKETQTNITTMISVGGVVVLIACLVYKKRDKIRQKCIGNTFDPDKEETNPLRSTAVEPDCEEPDEANFNDFENEDDPGEADDCLGSIKGMRNTEKMPLIGFRKRYKSCGDYESTSNGIDNQVDQDQRNNSKRCIAAFQRQLSHPVTEREVRNNEQQLDKRRPNEKCIRFLSMLLAADGMYKAFAKKMGLAKHKIKLLEEELDQRSLHPEDIAYEYINKTLKNTRKLSYRDVFDALVYLELHDEIDELRKNRHKLL